MHHLRSLALSAHRMRFVIFSLVLVLALSLLPAQAAQVTPLADQLVPVVIQMNGAQADLASQIQALGGRVVYDLPRMNALAAEVPAEAIGRLAENSAVARISLDTPIVSSSVDTKKVTVSEPTNTYLQTLGVDSLSNLTGEGIGVVVIDSGIANSPDFGNRLVERVGFSSSSSDRVSDKFGHGTHVAGIIGGDGKKSKGVYVGVAPGVNLISLKIGDDNGFGFESDALAAIEWVLDHQDQYNIKVVNLSINSTKEQYYRESWLNAAVELLWFNKIVVVASAGTVKNGDDSTIRSAPASDPFIITVGASDEGGSSDRQNDFIVNYSASGVMHYTFEDEDGNETEGTYTKPDIIAPGTNIISILAPTSKWKQDYPNKVILNNAYFSASGTSMAAPMVTGAVALLLKDEPGLTPDEVKCRLLQTASPISAVGSGVQYPYLNVKTAIESTSACGEPIQGGPDQPFNTNLGLPLAYPLAEAVVSSHVNWNSVNWNSVNWNSVNWNSVNWNSVNWNSVNWNSVNWNSVNWNSVNWNSVNWNSVNWNSINLGE